ncbi:MAG: multicopper oxidase family protein [Chloroflexi bacterium]|nr:multicopper oxidase family protein [Chloroflexota bacterium]
MAPKGGGPGNRAAPLFAACVVDVRPVQYTFVLPHEVLGVPLAHWLFPFAALFFFAIEAIALTTAHVTGAPLTETRRFTLYVRDGWLPTPDGGQIYVWGFTDDPNGPPKIPGPPIVVNEADTVEVILINDRDPTANALLPDGEGHTIHLHGLDVPTEHDGVPETHGPGLVRQGGSYTYKFTASHAGTYFYHCHQNNVEHQQMGMFGPLVVRTAGAAKAAYTGGPAYDREHTLVLAEMGAEGHEQARRAFKEGAEPYNWLRFTPDYALINERMRPGAQDAELRLDAVAGERVLARVINAGYAAHAISTPGQPFKIVASDGRPWPNGPTTESLSLGPGEKYDLMFSTAAGAILFRDSVVGAYRGPMIGSPSENAIAAAPTGRTVSQTLYVRDGSQVMPDGQRVYVYGFTDDPSGSARLPGPTVSANEGDTVEIALVNDRDPSGTGHGLQVLGITERIDGPQIVAPGERGTYRFTASRAGSYAYVDPTAERNRRMGLYGGLVVRPTGEDQVAYRGGPRYDREYTMVLSSTDAVANDSVRQSRESGGSPPSVGRFTPNYFFINGLAYPDTERDASTMVHASVGDRILIRAINPDVIAHAMHLHGYHFDVVAVNGKPWPGGPSKDTVLIGPGEAYDLQFLVDQPGTFPFHDHFETANTNNGVWLGGMHTLVAAGVAHQATPPTQPTAPEGPTIAVRDNFYTPNQLTVPVGSTVRWDHQGRVEHTVTSLLGYFDSGVLQGGDQFTYTFTFPGRYDFFCRFHITNRGVVVVQ